MPTKKNKARYPDKERWRVSEVECLFRYRRDIEDKPELKRSLT